jgi:spectinomycin phosphotransferase
MREPPRLADELILAALRDCYGICVSALTFLPLGNDTASSVYRIETSDGQPRFLKVRARRGFSAPSLAVPRRLADLGLPHILAPLQTVTGALWADVGEFALSLYPLINGRSGGKTGLSAEHWRTLGALMRRVHSAPLPTELSRLISREAFVPSRRDLLPALEAAVDRQPADDSAAGEFAALWRARSAEIHVVVDRADALADRLRHAPPEPVLCHADMHPWNVLIDGAEQLWLLDWDETILAPKECDLMFAVGGIGGDGVSPDTTSAFLAGYGDAAVDPVALAYYRYARAVQDIAAYGEQVFFLPELGEQSRREGVRGFMAQFTPESIVPRALATEYQRGTDLLDRLRADEYTVSDN